MFFVSMIGYRFYLFVSISVVALAFLIYSLLNLDSLRISIKHSRVFVEAEIFLIALIFIIWNFFSIILIVV
jgi:hypothetical protein